MKKKLVSIVVNCYNGEKYLSQTLQSLLNQKYKNIEVIFIDNCSTDKSASIFKKIKDKRFKYFKTKKKIKLYDSRNLALKKTKGNFIAFLDADDWWDKNFLSSRKKFLSSNKEYGFSYSNCYHYYENTKKFKTFYNKKLPYGFILSDLLKNYVVKISTTILKREMIKSVKFNSCYNIIGDYDLIIKISRKFKGMAFQTKLANIRIHKNNFTHNNRKMFYLEYKNWVNSQNFKDELFLKNKSLLLQKLEYLRIIHLLFDNKKFNLIFDIIKFPSFLLKLELLIIYFLPTIILKSKYRYF